MSIFDKLKNAAQAAADPDRETFTFPALPESLDQLRALPEAAMATPFQTAALTVCALCAYAAEPGIGVEMLNFLKGPQPLSNYELSFLKERFAANPAYLPFSYFQGAVPANDYTPSEPFTLTVEANPHSYEQEGYAVLYLRSGGADSPRQVKLRKKGEQWFLWEQMLTVGIRKSKSEDPWA